jgi:hypothetical protein
VSPRDTIFMSGLTAVGDRDLREAGRARQLGHASLVRRIAIAVHEDDRDGIEPLRARRLEIALHPGHVERPDHLAVRAHALGPPRPPCVEELRQAYVAVEDARAVLVGDAQLVAEAARDEEHRGSPLRSSSALVATVVPIFTASMRSTGIGASFGTPRRWRMPAIAASRYCPGSRTTACG